MRALLRPRIFISYARENIELARSMRDVLSARGFDVFFDEEVLGGEDFVRRLTDELRNADAVVTLLTPSSVTSEWCQAEWYFAHGRGLTVIPIRMGNVEGMLPTPLRLLENRIHFLTADQAERKQIGLDLVNQLDAVRRARRLRAAIRFLVAAALIGVLVFAFSRAEWLLRLRDRAALVQRIATAAQPLPAEEIARLAGRFRDDETLLGIVQRMTTSPEVSGAARLNAFMLSSELVKQQKPERRRFLTETTWRNGVIDGGSLVDVTFGSGRVEDLSVRRATLANVHWASRLTMSNASFRNVTFAAGSFSGTNVIRADFLACLFYGFELDVTNFALAKFHSIPQNPNEPNVITAGTLCAFENSVIVNRAEPPQPNILDLSVPETEVQFIGVGFTGVRFRGYIKAEWFRDCFFDRCTLPTSLRIDELEARGNRVTNSTQFDEPLD